MEKRYLIISMILVCLISVIRTAEATERKSVSSIRPDSYCTSSNPYPGESRRSCVYINTSAIRNRDAGIPSLNMPLMDGVTVAADLDRYQSLPTRSYSAIWQGHTQAGSLTRLHLSGSRTIQVNAEFWHQGMRYRIEPAGRYHRVIELGTVQGPAGDTGNDADIHVSTRQATTVFSQSGSNIRRLTSSTQDNLAITVAPLSRYAIGTGESGVMHFALDADGSLLPRASFPAKAGQQGRNADRQVALLADAEFVVVNQSSAYGLYRYDEYKDRLVMQEVRPLENGGQGRMIVAAPNNRDIYVVTAAPVSILHYHLNTVDGRLEYQAGYHTPDMRDITAIALSGNGRFVYAAEAAFGVIHGFAADVLDGRLISMPGSPFVQQEGGYTDIAFGPSGFSLLAIDATGRGFVSYALNSESGAMIGTDRHTYSLSRKALTMAVDARNSLLHVGNEDGSLGVYHLQPGGSLKWKAIFQTGDTVRNISLINF